MEHLIKMGNRFINFPFAHYATNVIFQQGNRPSGTLLEGKLYFSGCLATKLKCLWLQQDKQSGSITDLVIFQCNLDFHNQALNKYGKDKDIADATFV